MAASFTATFTIELDMLPGLPRRRRGEQFAHELGHIHLLDSAILGGSWRRRVRAALQDAVDFGAKDPWGSRHSAGRELLVLDPPAYRLRADLEQTRRLAVREPFVAGVELRELRLQRGEAIQHGAQPIARSTGRSYAMSSGRRVPRARTTALGVPCETRTIAEFRSVRQDRSSNGYGRLTLGVRSAPPRRGCSSTAPQRSSSPRSSKHADARCAPHVAGANEVATQVHG